MRSPLTAAIVAGGHARRLSGADKSRLVVAGRPIIVRQLEVLQSVADTVMAIGVPADRYDDLGLAAYPDVVSGAGAIGGILTALTAAGTDRVIVVGCDLPFLDAPLLRRLADLASGHEVAWVSTNRGPEPLLACYRSSIAPHVRERIDRGLLKAADLADGLRVAVVDTNELTQYGDPRRLLANINTADDYAQVKYAHS